MKVTGGYAKLTGGVSQQPPHLRRGGQHTEQINMISDPVNGVVRRHGSKWLTEKELVLPGSGSPTLSAVYTKDTESWQTFEYQHQGQEFAICARRAPRPILSDLPFMVVFNKTTGQFVPVVSPLGDPGVPVLGDAGVSAITSVGKYVFMAGGNSPVGVTSVDTFNDPVNQGRAAVWIRGGAYAKTYTVTATLTGGPNVTFDYTTPTSAYPGTLDTSIVPLVVADPVTGNVTENESAFIQLYLLSQYRAELTFHMWTPTLMKVYVGNTTPGALQTNSYPAAPSLTQTYSWAPGDRYVYFHSSLAGRRDVVMNYQRVRTVPNPGYATIVADIQNAYNTAVNQWIASAATAISPESIAQSLRQAAVVAGLSSATRSGSHLYFTNVKALSVSDGGDDSLIRGVANVISSPEKTTAEHFVGKVVRIRTTDAAAAYYFKAVARDGFSTGFTDVTWIEAPGTERSLSGGMFLGTYLGGTFYLASSAAQLSTILPGTHPDFSPSAVGDSVSVPIPYFVGKKITYLGVFQDRLLIGCDAVLTVSATGNYLNFFRSTMLTVPDSDAFEVLSQGSSDDVLRHSVLYNRDLMLIGDNRQYLLSGRDVLSPVNAQMQVMSSHRGMTLCAPRAAGSVVFYAQSNDASSSMHQIQSNGAGNDTESFPISAHIESYIGGRITEFQDYARPTMICARTNKARGTLYCFSYIDTPQRGRDMDSWSKWVFGAELGDVVGIGHHPDGVLVFSLVSGTKFDASGYGTWLVAHVCPTRSDRSLYPYLDAHRPWSAVQSSMGHVHPQSTGAWQFVYDTTSDWAYLGGGLATAITSLTAYPLATGPIVGLSFSSSVTITNPFVRDREGLAINTGVLVTNNMTVSTRESGGLRYTIGTSRGTTEYSHNARRMAEPNNLVERVPITSEDYRVVIMENTRDSAVSFYARSWMPLTVASIEWVGQFYNRPQRV